MWTDDHIRLLIDQRKSRNEEYHKLPGKSRLDFWNDVARTINRNFGTVYTGHQSQQKFNNLVKHYNVRN
jgi:hypothetical protein